jgi:hypothetical protein
VSDVVLAKSGSLAWSGENLYRYTPVPGGGPEYGVPVPVHVDTPPAPPVRKHILECSTTGEAVLAGGEGIDLKSLKLRGQNLSWVDAGEDRTAQLP